MISVIGSSRNSLFLRLLAVIFVCAISVTAYAKAPPKVVIVNGKKTLKLPDLFVRSLPKLAPGYRIPSSQDLKYLWSSESKKITGVPFACWGDYNGDGSIDIGIFLDKQGSWNFFVFHLVDGKYKKRLGNSISKYGPQLILAKTLKKGDTFTYKARERSYKFKYKNDAIVYSYDNGRIDIYTWVDGKLVEENLGNY